MGASVTKVIVRAAAALLFWPCQLESKEVTLSVIDAGMLVGDIVRRYPTTLEILTRHDLDLCCEAGYPLEVAAREHKLDLGRLLEQLNEVIDAG